MNLSSPKYTNQKGFAPIILILVVLVVLGAVVFVFTKNKSSNSNGSLSVFKKSSEESKTSATNSQNKNGNQDMNSTNSNYLVSSINDEVIILTDSRDNSKTLSIVNDKDLVTIYSDATKNKPISSSKLTAGANVKVEKVGEKTNIYVQI